MGFHLEVFFSVFEPVAIFYAIAAGIGFGAIVPLYVTLRWPPKFVISTRGLVFGIGAASMGAGALFFAGQIIQSILSGDPFWVRAFARATLWEVFSVSIAVGLGGALAIAHRMIDNPSTE